MLCYFEGSIGLPQIYEKGLELWHQAGELGQSEAYNNIGSVYYHGHGVERDWKKANLYWELAAMRGVAEARHNLGSAEYDYGNIDKALRHFMIAVKGGSNDTLESIQDMFKGGHVTKDDYSKALRAFQAYVGVRLRVNRGMKRLLSVIDTNIIDQIVMSKAFITKCLAVSTY